MVIKKAAVIGLGLIGGSIAAALKKAGIGVIGVDFDDTTLALAKSDEVIDEGLNIGKVIDGTAGLGIFDDISVAFMCLPVSAIASTLEKIMEYIPSGTIITDTGSVKKAVIREVEPVLTEGVAFVGGHPMAGSENSGYKWSRADMFFGAPYILTPTSNTDAEALWTMIKLVKDIGAKPFVMTPEEHDRAVAAVSHLPQIVSTTLVNTVEIFHPEGKVIELAGGGWRDTTRIASSNANMWKDIFVSNKDEILPLLTVFKEQLSAIESAIYEADEEKIKTLFHTAQSYKNRNSLL